MYPEPMIVDVAADLERAEPLGAHEAFAGLVGAELPPGAPDVPDATASAAPDPLAGTVHGTLGGRLGYALLDLDLDHRGAEITRGEILEQLRAQGFTGTAEVEVQEDDGKHMVKIRLEEHHAGEVEPLDR